MKTRIRVISILAVFVFALAANPMMDAKGAELTCEKMVLSTEGIQGLMLLEETSGFLRLERLRDFP